MSPPKIAQGEGPVYIFWDFEFCGPPSYADTLVAAKGVVSILRQYGRVRTFEAFMSTPTEEARGSPGFVKACSDLTISGATVRFVKDNFGKAALETEMMAQVMTLAMRIPFPATFAIISTDKHLRRLASTLFSRRFRVVVFTPPEMFDEMRSLATATYKWWDDVLPASILDKIKKDKARVLKSPGAKSTDFGMAPDPSVSGSSNPLGARDLNAHASPGPADPSLQEVRPPAPRPQPKRRKAKSKKTKTTDAAAVSSPLAQAAATSDTPTRKAAVTLSTFEEPGPSLLLTHNHILEATPLASTTTNVTFQSFADVASGMLRSRSGTDAFENLIAAAVTELILRDITSDAKPSSASMASPPHVNSESSHRPLNAITMADLDNLLNARPRVDITGPVDCAHCEAETDPVVVPQPLEEKLTDAAPAADAPAVESAVPVVVLSTETLVLQRMHCLRPPPDKFRTLVTCLEGRRLQGASRVITSQLGKMLCAINARAYKEAGCTKLKDYLAIAEQEGVIFISSDDALENGNRWVSLHPIFHGYSPPMW